MTDEEMAEESFKKYRTTDEDYEDLNGGEKLLVFNHEYGAEKQYRRLYKQGFLAGLKAGSPQWHDLRKDKNDLPKDIGIKLCYTRTAKYVCASYDEEYDCWGFVFNNLEHCIPSSVIIAWCEIPTFDKE